MTDTASEREPRYARVPCMDFPTPVRHVYTPAWDLVMYCDSRISHTTPRIWHRSVLGCRPHPLQLDRVFASPQLEKRASVCNGAARGLQGLSHPCAIVRRYRRPCGLAVNRLSNSDHTKLTVFLENGVIRRLFSYRIVYGRSYWRVQIPKGALTRPGPA